MAKKKTVKKKTSKKVMPVTKYISVKNLHLLENNPRQISEEDYARLKTSIRTLPEFFFARPCLISERTGKKVIIGGNMRYRAAIDVGLKEVPCHTLKGLTEAKEREIIARDNIQNGEWDFDMLANEWDIEDLKEWGVDVPNLDDLGEGFELPSGEKEPFQQKSFVLHNSQVEIVKLALSMANQESKVNENKNGNAISNICEAYINGNG